MDNYICRTCGIQYAASAYPPLKCIICEDERKFVGWAGYRWTTLNEMKNEGYRNEIRTLEPGITSVSIEPTFAIGQRAILVQTPKGNVLWDAISYIDEKTIDKINTLGGIHAISASHPHFYGSMVEWSHAFGRAPIYIPYADKDWVVRPDPVIEFYKDTKKVFPDVTIIQCGGHFDGSAVLYWACGAEGKGVLFVGDTITVAQDRKHVSFMYSYPNYIPLPPYTVERIVEAVKPYKFDRIYGAWLEKDITEGGKSAIERSAERYIRQIKGKLP